MVLRIPLKAFFLLALIIRASRMGPYTTATYIRQPVSKFVVVHREVADSSKTILNQL